MSQDIVVRQPQTQQLDVLTVGGLIAKSGYFQDAQEQAQAVVKILAGQEIGVGPIASMMGIFLVNGKPTYAANLIAALIKRSGRYDYRVRSWTIEACEIVFYEGGTEAGVSSFTMDDARAAELTNGKNAHSWKHYPRNMLFARALTNGARTYCPDVSAGIPLYTPEELGAAVTVNGDTGDVTVVETTPAEAPAAPNPSPRPATSTAPKRTGTITPLADDEAIPFDGGPASTADAPPWEDHKSAGAPSAPGLVCADCGEPLTETKFRDGTVWTPSQLAAYGQRKHGRVLDMACYRKANDAVKAKG